MTMNSRVTMFLAAATLALAASAKVGEKGFKNLFFDDQRIFLRENLKRVMGHPEPIAAYQDPVYDTPLCSGWTFRCDDGKYRMAYMVLKDTHVDQSGNVVGADAPKAKLKRVAALALAVSDDAVNWKPNAPHVVSDDTWDLGEIACVVEDTRRERSADERYLALCCTKFIDSEFRHANYLMASPDLVHWRKIPNGVTWHDVGTEPITSCFWNPSQRAYTLLTRPQCGERRVGWSLTKDFRTFTPPQFCMQCGPEDEPMAELYGALGFEYDGWYVALPFLYGNQQLDRQWKGGQGNMVPYLAYSLNGLNYQRVFHEPFFRPSDPKLVALTGRVCPMLWPASTLRDKDGSLLIYAVADGFDHGRFFQARRESWITTWRLREDGFVKLVSENPDNFSRLCTRPNIWRDGELEVNLKCRGIATVMVLEKLNENNQFRTVPGFHHHDCENFVGDSTRWTPKWKKRTLSELKGKNVAFEVKFWDGELYSISGDMTPVMYVQQEQYLRLGKDPFRPGW